MREITAILYNNICRGLFNTHKLIFSFMIATRILIQAGHIAMSEWNLFLKGVMMDGDIKNIKNPDPSIISEKTWRFVLNLECTSPGFDKLPESIVSVLASWKSWFLAKEP
jgi:dynein heavy chain